MEPNIHLAFLRRTLLTLPGVIEKPSYGTPGFFAGKKLFARVKEDGVTLVVQSFTRDAWMDKDPDTFFITDHYLNYDYVLVNMLRVIPDDLVSLLITGYRNQATPKILTAFEANLKIL